MDEREDLQNIEDNINATMIDSSVEEQTKAPPIEIEEIKADPTVPEYSEFPVEPLPEGLTYKAPKREAPKKVIEIPKGPVEITADGFYLIGKLGERLYKKSNRSRSRTTIRL